MNMQITIENMKLNKLLKRVAKCIGTTKDAFSEILLKVIERKIYCVVINNFTEIATYETFNNVQKNIEIIINYDLIYNISRKTDLTSSIIIKKEKKHLEILTQDSLYKVPRKTNVFPSLELDSNKLLKIGLEAGKFLYLLKHIKLSILDSDIDNLLNKAILEINNNSLTGMTSDGLRLSFFNTKINIYSKKNFKITLNKNNIKNIINTFENDNYLNMIIYNNKFKIISENIMLTFAIAHEYYKTPEIIIDKENLKVINMTKSIILKILEKIDILKIDNNRITVKITQDKVLITGGNFTESVTCFVNYTTNITNDLTTSFNYKHLKEILRLINNIFFDFIIANDNKIIIIKEPNSEILHIIMPFNI